MKVHRLKSKADTSKNKAENIKENKTAESKSQKQNTPKDKTINYRKVPTTFPVNSQAKYAANKKTTTVNPWEKGRGPAIQANPEDKNAASWKEPEIAAAIQKRNHPKTGP